MSKENYFSDSHLKDKPQKRLALTLNKGSVTTDKIADDSVTHSKLAANSVGTSQVIDGAVTTDKIADKAVTSAKLDDESVLISNIAQEVWNKLKDEYLRLDGYEEMRGTIGMNKNAIENLSYISGMSRASIRFFGDVYPMEFMKHYEGDTEDELAKFTYDMDFDVTNGNSIADGFKTHNRTNIGLLVNNGTVGLALTDSEIDGITSSVFTNYDNITE